MHAQLLAILFIVLVSVRIDRLITGSWLLVCIPLIIIVAVSILLFIT